MSKLWKNSVFYLFTIETIKIETKNKNERTVDFHVLIMNFDKMFQHKQISNVAQLLNRRSLGLDKSAKDPLHVYGESCAASFCSSNHKVDLPPRSRSTFMTAFSPNHELMASCHGDHNVHVTNLQSRKVVKSLIGHERTPWCISFHPSCNDILATGCLNGEVCIDSWFAKVNF